MANKKGGEIIGAVLIFFVLLFVYTKLAGPIPFTINNITTSNTIPFEVTGSGKAAAAPDKAVVSLGITQTGNTVLDAQSKTNQASEKIINALKAIGITQENIKTTNYSINPNYDFTTPTQRITGYSVNQNFEVEVEIDKANQVVDTSTANGANNVGGIVFKLDEDKEQEMRNQARKEAIEEAKKSAQGLADASGIKLGKIINIRESFGGEIMPMPVALDARMGGELEKSTTNITPGESNIEVFVTITYQTN